MHADEAVRPLRGGGQRGHGDRRGIGCQNGLGAQHSIRLAQHPALQLQLLRHRLNGQVGASDGVEIGDRLDAAQNRGLFGIRQFAFPDLAIEILGDILDRPVEKLPLDVAQDHAIAVAREDVRNPITHGAAAQDGYGANALGIQKYSPIGKGKAH